MIADSRTGYLTRAFLAGFVCLALLLPAAPAGAAGYRDTALSFVRQLVRFFPAAEGFVVSMPGGEIYVDLAEADLLQPGMEMLVYREGEDIVHPVTGDILGKYEERVGYLTVTEVEEKYSVGTPVEGAAEVKVGDRVRLSSRPLRSLLFFAAQSEAVEAARLARELVDAAAASGRFRLKDEPEWLASVSELGLSMEGITGDAGALRELGRSLKSDLLFVVTPAGSDPWTINLEIFSLWTGRRLAAYREAWSPPPAVPVAAEETRGGFARLFDGARKSEVTSREYMTKNMPGEVRSIAIGEMTGDAIVDVLVTDGGSLTLYSWDGGGLIWQWEGGGEKARRILNLESGDLDGDGRQEVLVTAVTYGRLATDILSWSGGEWYRVSREEGIYLRLFPDGERTVILGQRAGRNTVFSGPVREYAWTEGRLATVEGGTLPSGVNIFGLGLADINGDGETEYLSMDSEGKIRIVSTEGEVLSYGRDRYGGYPPIVQTRDLFGPGSPESNIGLGFFNDDNPDDTSAKGAEEDIRTSFKGRVLVGGARGYPGAAFVAVPKNLSTLGKVLPNLRQFEKGAVALLQWRDGRLEHVGESRSQEGYIADIALWDLNGDGVEEIFMAVNKLEGALLKKRGSLVLWRHLQPGAEGVGGQ